MIRTYLRSIKNNGLVQNAFINTIAAAVSVFSLQLIVLPLLGRKMESDEYGLVLSILSVLNVIPATFGNSLNNIRLLYNSEYEKKKVVGDFAFIFLVEAIINVILVVCLSRLYINSDLPNTGIHLCFIGIIAALWIAREYYIVAFLIQLNYKSILVNNILCTIGYFIGFCLFLINNYWECIYIAGLSMSLFFIIKKTDIWKEKLNRTTMFVKVIKEDITYIGACLLYRITSYADKLLLFPMLGGTQVSIYYTATLSGKVVSLLITPLTGVMLSYLAKFDTKEGDRSFQKVSQIGILVCIMGYVICMLVSKPILTLLYPQFVNSAMELVPITTATVVIGIYIALINPYILRYFTMRWQVVINIFTVIAYVGLSFAFLLKWSVRGFALGCCLANTGKLLLMLFVYFKVNKRKN